MTSVPSLVDPDNPLDEWESVTDLDSWLDGFERVHEPAARGSVAELVNALLREYVPRHGIIRVLHAVGRFEEWSADPVCLACGLPGGFTSPSRDEADNLCCVCRTTQERDAQEGMAALVERLKWLQTSAGRRAARADAKARQANANRLFPPVSGRPRDDSDIEAAIDAIMADAKEPTFTRVADSLYGSERRLTQPYNSLYQRLDGRDGRSARDVFDEIVRRHWLK